MCNVAAVSVAVGLSAVPVLRCVAASNPTVTRAVRYCACAVTDKTTIGTGAGMVCL